MNIPEIEKIIGYTFKDKTLLECAFTHSSYANDNGTASNEQLEFLGDGLLGFIVAEKLYATHSDEGEMSVKRAALVEWKALSPVIDSYKLSKHIRFGLSEIKKDHSGTKVLADVFEAIIGAAYLDGGIDAAKSLVFRLIDVNIRSVNYKGDLQEYVQQYKLGDIKYTQTGVVGSAHMPEFEVAVSVGGQIFGEGTGKRLKDAEAVAAEKALEKIKSK